LNDLREVQPHWVHAPPRFWEKLRASTESSWLLAAPRSARLCRQAMAGRGGLLSRVVRHRLRASLGLGGTYRAYSGGSLLSPDAQQWYASLGIELIDLYESAETCGPVFVLGAQTFDARARVGPLGELQLQSDALAVGYWSQGSIDPLRSTDVGWLDTGDCAELSGRSVAQIRGRLADSFSLTCGARTAPDTIESSLQSSAYIAAALVVGAQRECCTSVLSLEEDSVLRYAQSRGIAFTDYAALVERPEIIELIQREIDAVNRQLAEHERVRRFRLLPRMLRAGDPELTPLMRVQRQSAHRSFQSEIDALYAA